MKHFSGTARRWRLLAALLGTAAAVAFGSAALAARNAVRTSLGFKVGNVWDAQGNAGVDVGRFANVDLGHISLPKGSYLVTAKVSLKNTSGSGNFECRVRDGSGNLDDAEVTTAGAFKGAAVPLQAVVTYGSTTTVYLTCRADQGFASWWRLDAIAVGKVH